MWIGTLPFLARFDLFLLFFIRASALVISSPIFGRANIPVMMRAGLALFVGIAFFYGRPDMPPLEIQSVWEYGLICVRELLLGLCFGFATQLFFTAIHLSGTIIDMQIGLSMAQVFDPQTHMQVPITGNLFEFVLLMSFFIVGGHLRLIGILSDSIERIPIGAVAVHFDQLAAAAATTFGTAFVLGFQVAMPVIAAALVLEAALGVMNRSVPQLNMYVLGLPIKVVMGLVLLMWMLPTFVEFSNGVFTHMYNGIGLFMEGLVPSL